MQTARQAVRVMARMPKLSLQAVRIPAMRGSKLQSRGVAAQSGGRCPANSMLDEGFSMEEDWLTPPLSEAGQFMEMRIAHSLLASKAGSAKTRKKNA